MNKQLSLYKYHFRPEYHSTNLLIEIFSGVENEDFGKDFLMAIEEIKPQIVDLQDLWINDEYVLTIDSEVGSFLFSKDVWGFAFLTSESSQSCVARINLLLRENQKFEKIEPDFNNYI